MICIFLANGFEMIEALTPCDVLKRAGADVKLVSVTDTLAATSTHGVTVGCDLMLSDLDRDEIDMIILPGGMPGAQNLYHSEALCQLTVAHAKKGKPTAAICAAPFILGKLGLLSGKSATCYPGFEEELKGATATGESVVTDGNITTARGMGVALDFADELVALIAGEEKKRALSEAVMEKK